MNDLCGVHVSESKPRGVASAAPAVENQERKNTDRTIRAITDPPVADLLWIANIALIPVGILCTWSPSGAKMKVLGTDCHRQRTTQMVNLEIKNAGMNASPRHFHGVGYQQFFLIS
jgi:hypothetical protein